MQYAFGSGSLWGINSAANSTPMEFGALQDVTLDFSFTLKELRGQYQAPLTIARGAMKITGKAKFANISARVFNDLFFGQTSATGQVGVVKDETATVPTTPYQVTVAQNATFKQDLGVQFNATGAYLVRDATTPTLTGHYSVNESTGIYTFAAADVAKVMRIDYSYNIAATGNKTTLTNQLMGAGPTFKIILTETYNGQAVTIELNACVSNKLAFATKLEDFVIPEIDFECMADSSNAIGTISVVEP
jgi:hypothetical protein